MKHLHFYYAYPKYMYLIHMYTVGVGMFFFLHQFKMPLAMSYALIIDEEKYFDSLINSCSLHTSNTTPPHKFILFCSIYLNDTFYINL